MKVRKSFWAMLVSAGLVSAGALHAEGEREKAVASPDIGSPSPVGEKGGRDKDKLQSPGHPSPAASPSGGGRDRESFERPSGIEGGGKDKDKDKDNSGGQGKETPK